MSQRERLLEGKWGRCLTRWLEGGEGEVLQEEVTFKISPEGHKELGGEQVQRFSSGEILSGPRSESTPERLGHSEWGRGPRAGPCRPRAASALYPICNGKPLEGVRPGWRELGGIVHLDIDQKVALRLPC